MHFIIHVVNTTEHVVEQRVKWTTSLGKSRSAFWIRFRYLYLSIVGWCDIGRLSGYRRRLGEYHILAQRLGRNHVRRRIAVRLVMHFIIHVVNTTEHVVEQRVKWTTSLGKSRSAFWIRFRYLYLSIVGWCDIGRLSEH